MNTPISQPVTFLVWTENSPGVLLRLTTLFTRRKLNVESLTVSATETAGISRFTVVIQTDPVKAATIGRQIERMIEVRRVFVFAEPDIIHREVALVRAKISDEREVTLHATFADIKTLQRSPNGTLLQCTGTESDISALLSFLAQDEVTEFVRSGRIAVSSSFDYAHDLSRSLHELRPEANEGPDF
jgi:acetolactate synthase-1/3 small subunit